MSETKLTPTQKLKLAEAEIADLKKAIFKLQDQHAKETGTALATHGNEQYSLGYAEGLADGRKEMEAAIASQTVINRWFRK